jgi:hypothetical protein
MNVGICIKAKASNCVRVHVFGCAIHLNPHCAAGAYDAWLTEGRWIFGTSRSSEIAFSESSLTHWLWF